MAKIKTPTVKQITEKLKRMGFHKFNGTQPSSILFYRNPPKKRASTRLQIREAKPAYTARKKK